MSTPAKPDATKAKTAELAAAELAAAELAAAELAAAELARCRYLAALGLLCAPTIRLMKPTLTPCRC